MNWEAFIDAIKEWARGSTGIDLVYTANEATGYLADLVIYLRLSSVVPIGIDETKLEEIEGVMRAVQVGTREFTIQVVIESQTQRPDDWAPAYAEKLRTNGSSPRMVGPVNEAGLVLVDFGETITEDEEQEGRMVSRAMIPVRWRAASVVVDESAEAEWIETAEVEPNFRS